MSGVPTRDGLTVAYRCARCHRLSYGPSGNCEHSVPEQLVPLAEVELLREALAENEQLREKAARYDALIVAKFGDARQLLSNYRDTCDTSADPQEDR